MIAGAVAHGWRHDVNRHEAMDAELAPAVAEEVRAVLQPRDAQNAFFRPPRRVSDGLSSLCPDCRPSYRKERDASGTGEVPMKLNA